MLVSILLSLQVASIRVSTWDEELASCTLLVISAGIVMVEEGTRREIEQFGQKIGF